MKNKNSKGGFFIFTKILSVFVFILGGVFIFSVPARAVNIIISEDTHWDDGQIIIINDYDKIIINNKATLTLNPGAIIKLGNKSRIEVLYGNLKIQGSSEKPAVITSLKDDKMGGDSNWDSGTTKPAPGDWDTIIIFGSVNSLIINYAEIKYGDYIAAASSVKEMTITNSSILNFRGFISAGQSQSVKINYNNIYNPDFCTYNNPFNGPPLEEPFCGGAELWNDYIYYVDATNNYWGHPRGATRNQFDIKGTIVRGRIYYNPFLSEKIQLWPEEEKLNPVIIVPGILGSFLNRNELGSPEIWPNVYEMLKPGDDDYLNELALMPNGWPDFSDNLIATDAIRKIITKDFFQGLITELENNGYEEGKNLFVFPYDWRLDINWLAGESPLANHPGLKEKIEEVKAATGMGKVDIIAHSMGGLIVKKYFSKYGQTSVDKFIDIATPHLGAPKAFKALMYGDDFGFSAFGLGLNQNTIKSISQNMPAVYQLLPSQEYFNISDFNIPDPDYKNYIGDIYDFDSNNIKGNLDYDQTAEFMKNTGRNSDLLALSDNLHKEIDNLTVPNTFNIVGCGKPTIGKIYVLNKEKSGGFEYALKYISGDSTVPLRSAEAISSSKIYIKGSEHAGIPSAEGAKQLVASILKGEQANFNFSQYPNLSLDKNICSFSGTQVSYHSPIELHIYDENNNHLGPKENGDIELGIDGASYDVIEENKFAFLPAGHNYRVVGKATDTGTFNARVEPIENGVYKGTVYYNEVPLSSASSTIQFTVSDGQNNYSMSVDNEGDGNFDQEILPSSILNEEEAGDLIKPETSISITGIQGNDGWYVSDAFIGLSAQDNEGGAVILKTEYSLDNGGSWENYTAPFTLSQEREDKIIYSSTDRAGNREEPKEEVIKIDKTGPVIDFVVPYGGEEFLRSESFQIEYLAEDNISGIATSAAEVFLDGVKINPSETIDLFYLSLGEHTLKINLADRAGNISIWQIKFKVAVSIESAISDIERSFNGGLIFEEKVKNKLTERLNWIKDYIEKAGEKKEKRDEKFAERMNKCLEKKEASWCEEKIGGLRAKIYYKLDEVYKKVVLDKYEIILKELESYYKKDWLSDRGYDIIKEDIIYLINNL